jgi:hypothetical protein
MKENMMKKILVNINSKENWKRGFKLMDMKSKNRLMKYKGKSQVSIFYVVCRSKKQTLRHNSEI